MQYMFEEMKQMFDHNVKGQWALIKEQEMETNHKLTDLYSKIKKNFQEHNEFKDVQHKLKFKTNQLDSVVQKLTLEMGQIHSQIGEQRLTKELLTAPE